MPAHRYLAFTNHHVVPLCSSPDLFVGDSVSETNSKHNTFHGSLCFLKLIGCNFEISLPVSQATSCYRKLSSGLNLQSLLLWPSPSSFILSSSFSLPFDLIIINYKTTLKLNLKTKRGLILKKLIHWRQSDGALLLKYFHYVFILTKSFSPFPYKFQLYRQMSYNPKSM